MRKIKKLLALALAAVMAVSVMSMSASANSTMDGTVQIVENSIACGPVTNYWKPELRETMDTGLNELLYGTSYTPYVDRMSLTGAASIVRIAPDVEAYYRNGGTLYLAENANNYGEGMGMPGGVDELGFYQDDMFKNLVIGGSTIPAEVSTVNFFGTHCFENSALETIVFENTWNPDAVYQAWYNGKSTDYKTVTFNITSAEQNNFCLGINGFIIEDYAFANCKNLTSVVFQTEPALYIGTGAFTGCPNLTITAPVGGAIEAHCIENGIKFVPYTDNNGNVVQANNRLFTNGCAPELGYIRQTKYSLANEHGFSDASGNYICWPNDPANYTPNPVMSGNYVFSRDTTAEEPQPEPDTTTPQESAAPDGTFSDVRAGDWYYAAVEWAAASGVVSGSGDGGFNPTGNLLRCELAQVLYNMAGQPGVDGLSNPFDDVSSGDWYYAPVVWAAANGVVNGSGDGSFSPMGVCTRSALAQVIYNTFERPAVTAFSNPFTDVPESQWYYNPVIWCASDGIVNGSDNGTFEPNGVCQRCALAQVMYNMELNGIRLPL